MLITAKVKESIKHSIFLLLREAVLCAFPMSLRKPYQQNSPFVEQLRLREASGSFGESSVRSSELGSASASPCTSSFSATTAAVLDFLLGASFGVNASLQPASRRRLRRRTRRDYCAGYGAARAPMRADHCISYGALFRHHARPPVRRLRRLLVGLLFSKGRSTF